MLDVPPARDAVSVAHEYPGRVRLRGKSWGEMGQTAESSSTSLAAEALLDSLYGSAPIGLGFWDCDLRYVRVNAALAAMNERSPEDHVGRTFAEVVPQLAHVIEPIARRVLETREPIVALEVSAGSPSQPDQQRDWLASYYPVISADGSMLGVGCVIEEVTDRRRADRRAELQHSATHILAGAESFAVAIPRVLEAVCETLGWDVACLWSVDPEQPRLTWSRPGLEVGGFLAMTERAALATTLLPARVAASGQAEWLVDLSPDRFSRASVAEAEGLRSGVAFPISIDGEVAGVLEVFSRQRRPEDPELRASLASLGVQIGQFVLRKRAEDERANLLERERRARADAEASAATLRKLQRVSEVALEHLPLPELLSSLLARIVEVFEAETAAVFLLSDDGLLRIRSFVGLDREIEHAVPIPLGTGLVGRVAADRVPLVVPDLSKVELVSPVLRQRGINSIVAIPLVVDDDVIGVVHAGSTEHAKFSDDDARLLELIADRIALAINQATLSEAERVAQERLRFLSEASVVLSSSLDLDLTLRRAAQLAVARFADAAVVDLVVGDRIERVVIEVAEQRITAEIRDGLFANPPSPDDLGGSAKVVRTGEPEILLDLDADPSPLARVTRGRPGIQRTVDLLRPKSLVYMPLKARGHVLGVLALIRTVERFHERDVETVRELAARAAVAVDNAHLFRDAELTRDRLGFLAEASARLGASLDVDSALGELSSSVAGRHADWCAIHLAEEDGRRLVSVAHRDPERSALARAAIAELSAAGATEGVGRVIATGTPELFPEVPEELLVGAAREVGVHSTLVVPLVARGRTLGAMSWAWAETDRAYGPADLDFALDLARRAAIAIDNTQLYREAEERAQASRVLASVGDGVFLVDRQGVIRTWNRAAATATGLRSREVIDRLAVDAIPGWGAIVAQIPAAAAGGGAPRAESLPLDLGGRELWLSVHGVAVPDGTVYAFRDLTEERALEAMRTEFVSTVSHELRTPLAAIYGAAMTLRRSDVALSDDQRARLLDVVSGEADRLARTVNDILWASRLDAGSLHVSIQSCDPVALIHGVVEAQRAHLGGAHDLVLTAEDDLPQVAGDPDKVGRVLINLVDNAVKYSPDGGKVDVQVRQTGGHVRFSIVDHGLGIPLAEQRRIFEKFYRLDPNMTRGVGGTGLGLYICRELLRRMDGRIWVESAGLGLGAAFHIELPVAGSFTAHFFSGSRTKQGGREAAL